MVRWFRTALMFRKNFLIVLTLVLSAGNTFAQADSSSFEATFSERTLLDSLLKKFSIEELVRFKDSYFNEINLHEKEIKLHLNKGINDGERFYSINPDAPFMDKV